MSPADADGSLSAITEDEPSLMTIFNQRGDDPTGEMLSMPDILQLSSSSSPPGYTGGLPSISPRRRGSFSSEIELLQSSVLPGVLMEARMVLPFMRHYAMPTRFAVLNFRCDPCLVPTPINSVTT
jgi:hypothetical protein